MVSCICRFSNEKLSTIFLSAIARSSFCSDTKIAKKQSVVASVSPGNDPIRDRYVASLA